MRIIGVNEMKYDRNVFAQNIKMIMGDKRITQSKLAEKIGSEQPTISKRLNGNGDFTLSQAVEIADVLKCPLDELLKDRDKPTNTDIRVESMSDILSMLFKIAVATPLKIKLFKAIEDVELVNSLDEPQKEIKYFEPFHIAIEFENKRLSSTIKKWGDILKLGNNDGTVDEVLTIWQEKQLEKYKEVMAKWEMRDMDELEGYIIKHIYSPNIPAESPLTPYDVRRRFGEDGLRAMNKYLEENADLDKYAQELGDLDGDYKKNEYFNAKEFRDCLEAELKLKE